MTECVRFIHVPDTELDNHLRTVANICDFGAVADGGVTDNAPHIEAAAASISGKRGVLYFPGASSYYGVARPVALVNDGYSGMTICGDGPQSRIKLTANPTSFDIKFGVQIQGIITIAGSTSGSRSLQGLTLRDLRLSGQSITSGTDGLTMMCFCRMEGLLIERCEFDYHYYEGVYCVRNGTVDNDRITFRNCFFHEIGGHAGTVPYRAAINPSGSRILVENNRVQNVGQFIETNSDSIIVQNNVFRNAMRVDTSTPGVTINVISGMSDANPPRVVVQNNEIVYAERGIYIDPWYLGSAGTTPVQVVVQGNKLYRCRTGIAINNTETDGHVARVVIADNQLSDTDGITNSGAAISVRYPAIIENNTMELPGANKWGQFIRTDLAESNDVTVRGNTFIGEPNSTLIYCGAWQPEISHNRVISPGNAYMYWGGNWPSWSPSSNIDPYSPETVLSSTHRTRVRISTTPIYGSWKVGDIAEYITPAAGGYLGLVCTAAGTLGTLSGITGSIDAGANLLTVSGVSTIGVGSYISIAGVTGTKRVTSVSGSVLTLHSNSDATVSGAAVQFVAPTFKTYGAISA